MEIINLKDNKELMLSAKENELKYHNPDFIFSGDNVVNYCLSNEEKIIGGVDYQVVIDEADILFIYINENERGKGLSKFLLSKTLNSIKNLGVRNVFLEVRKSNLIAYNLYKSNGFIEIGERKAYYDDLEDAIIMKRELL